MFITSLSSRPVYGNPPASIYKNERMGQDNINIAPINITFATDETSEYLISLLNIKILNIPISEPPAVAKICNVVKVRC